MLEARAASAHGVARVSQRSRRVQARVGLTPSEKSRLGKKRTAPVERYDIPTIAPDFSLLTVRVTVAYTLPCLSVATQAHTSSTQRRFDHGEGSRPEGS